MPQPASHRPESERQAAGSELSLKQLIEVIRRRDAAARAQVAQALAESEMDARFERLIQSLAKKPQAPAEADLRLALATALVKAGPLSLGGAARVAGIGVAELVSHVSRLGSPVVHGNRAEAESDLQTLEEWLASS